MPRTKEQYEAIKIESKLKIERAGLKLFIEKGLLSTSVGEIALEAGISKGLMYHYYKSKEDLYYELVGEAINLSIESITNIFNLSESPKEKIKIISKNITDNINKGDETAKYFVFINRFLISENALEKAEELIEKAYIPIELTEKIIEEGQKIGDLKKGEPKALALLFWSAVHGLCANKLIMRNKFVELEKKLLEEILIREC